MLGVPIPGVDVTSPVGATVLEDTSVVLTIVVDEITEDVSDVTETRESVVCRLGVL